MSESLTQALSDLEEENVLKLSACLATICRPTAYGR